MKKTFSSSHFLLLFVGAVVFFLSIGQAFANKQKDNLSDATSATSTESSSDTTTDTSWKSLSIPTLPTHLFEKKSSPTPSLSPLPRSAPLPPFPETITPKENGDQEEPLSPLSPEQRIQPIPLPETPPQQMIPQPPPEEEPPPLEEERDTFLFEEQKEKTMQQQQRTLQKEREGRETFGITGEVSNIAVTELLQFLSRITGKNFVFEEKDLQFNVSFTSHEDEPVENIFSLLLQQLQSHNLSLTEQGNTILIHPNKNVRSPGEIVIEGKTAPPSGEIITQVFPLNTLDPNKAAELIRPLLSTDAIILVLQDSNHLLVTDVKANIEKISDLIANLDAPIGGMVIGQYRSQNGMALSLVTSAEQILLPIAQGNPFYLVPHQPTNSIFVISNPFLVDRAISIMRYLDTSQGKTRIINLEEFKKEASLSPFAQFGIDEDTEEAARREEEERVRRLLEQGWQYDIEGNLVPPGTALTPQARISQELPPEHIGRTLFFIYKLQYRSGDQIVQALRQIASALFETGTVNEDLVNAINSIQWIESTNSLIFTGTAEALERIKELIVEIDIPLRQIFLEVLILDTTITDSLSFGVDWGSRFGGGDWSGSQAFLRAGSPLPDALDTTGIDSTPDAINLISSTVGGYNMGIIGQNLTKMGMRFNSVGSLVTAIHQDQHVHIVMNPKILAEDNYTAEIFVGTTDRFKTQTVPNEFGTVLTSNFETVDVGTTLRVTPHLGDNDIITLDIEQENTNEAPEATAIASGSATSDTNLIPVTTKNKTVTRVHVPNQYFLVLSGMLSDNPLRAENRVPCLGGFPLVGTVFRQKTVNDTKRNLMIFIRPEIVDTDEDFQRITQRNQDIFKEKGKFIRRWTYETDEALDWASLKTTEPNESCRMYKPADCPVCCPTK